MSQFADYKSKANSYDATRQPIGLDDILYLLSGLEEAARRIKLLDAGCGTGNYSVALSQRLNKVVGLDIEQALLDRAEKKKEILPADAKKRLVFVHGDICDTEIGDSEFDAVLASLVMHHLDKPGSSDNARKAIIELARVLRADGRLVIVTCSQQQLQHGYWFLELSDAAAQKVARRYPPIGGLDEWAMEAGLEKVKEISPTSLVLMGEEYFDPNGPLDEEWRAGDSFWELVDATELRKITEKWEKMTPDRREAAMRQFDRNRFKTGQVTLICYRKK